MAGTAVLRIVSNRCVPGPMAAGPAGSEINDQGDEYDARLKLTLAALATGALMAPAASAEDTFITIGTGG